MSFSVFDKESTGIIQIDEFKHVLKAIGDKLTPDEVTSIFRDNQNRQIPFFMNWTFMEMAL